MASGPKIKPGLAGIWIGLLLIIVGFGGCIGGLVWGGVEVANAIEDIDKFPVPGSQSYDFEANASGVIFSFAPTSGNAKEVQATLVGPDGQEIAIDSNASFTGQSNTDSAGDAVELLGAFDAKEPGRYTLTAEGPDGAEVGIANISVSSILTKFGGGIGAGILLPLIGLILLIVTMVRRSKAKKNMAMNPGGFNSPGGMPAPMAPQFPPAPGQAPQFPPAPGQASQFPPAPGQAPQSPPAPGQYAPPPAPGQYPAPPSADQFPPPPAAPPGQYPPPPSQPDFTQQYPPPPPPSDPR